ncbi:MAG: carbohydrate-binding family 9-like protein [Massilibacteroides sp.]|nr:carbohydrate-binding family 9-like protein [Massilibacteroides sp.]MDD3062124.1 carbohydrate-binding family 9-like protein [Massilibacteroides sp.]MDD4114700.1 carbohydrate-binding family 9-like protein [Massilibacteroides sp.]MDD4660315.1 carbohydrate-binding family 9-like protein [Massilibacteroides sp.]
MKNLIPNLPALDVLDLSSVGYFLENKSLRLFVNTVNWAEYAYKPIVVVDVARTDKNLYLRYFVKGYSLKATYGQDGSPVFRDSCVEFFVQPPRGPYKYMNFEFNCIGTCDASYRQSREEKTGLTPQEYASIRRYPSFEAKPFDEKTGIYSWELIVAIPFELMGITPKRLPEKIRANFYKCADDTQYPHFLSWAPIDLPEPDFHCPDFFGDLYFR